MSLLDLFLTFFKIGLFSFGGGYGTIPLIKTEVQTRNLMDEKTLLDFIGISESTPGPFAVNIATFIGCDQAGFLGGVLATLGVILPAFLIILLICVVLKNFKNNKYVKGFLNGVEPFVVGLIAYTGISIIIKSIWVTMGDFSLPFEISVMNLIVTAVLFVGCLIYKKLRKKNMPAILLIIISAVIGIIFM